MNFLLGDQPMRLLVLTLVYLLTVTSMEGGLLVNELDHLIDQMLDLEELQQVVRLNFLR